MIVFLFVDSDDPQYQTLSIRRRRQRGIRTSSCSRRTPADLLRGRSGGGGILDAAPRGLAGEGDGET